MRLKIGPLPTMVTLPESDVETLLQKLKRLDESVSTQPIAQDHRDLSQEIIETLKTITSEEDELFVIDSHVPSLEANAATDWIGSVTGFGSLSAPATASSHLKSQIAASDSAFSSASRSVDSRSKSSHSTFTDTSPTGGNDTTPCGRTKKLTISLELLRATRRETILKALREVGFKDAEVPRLDVGRQVEVHVSYLRGMEMLGKSKPEGTVDIKYALSDCHRLVSVSLDHDENEVFPHQHKPAYFLAHFAERKRRATAMPYCDPQDLLSLVPASYGIVEVVASSPSSWSVFFVDHVSAVTFVEKPPKVISQYPCLGLKITCHLSLSLERRIRSPLFPVSIKASRQTPHDSGEFNRSTETWIALALQLDGIELFHLQSRQKPCNAERGVNPDVSEGVLVSWWDLFFSSIHHANSFRILGHRKFEELLIELVPSTDDGVYTDKVFLGLNV